MKKLNGFSLGEVLVILFFIIVFIIVGNSTKNNNTDNSSSTQQVSQEQKQERIDKINSILQQMQQEGLIVSYKEPMYFYINEKMWNSLPYETKEQAIKMFLERYKLTDKPYTLIGYHTGEKIQDAKNFK